MATRLIVALVLLLLAAGVATYQQSRIGSAQRERDDARTERSAAVAAQRAAEAALKASQAATTVVTEYVERVQIVRERGATIVKEVPVYVTPNADAACTVPAGFVRLFNAAAQGTALDATADDPDAPAQAVALSTVASVTTDNFAICHENAATVTALQQYIEGQLDAQP